MTEIWTDEGITRLLGACDGMVGCLVKLQMKIAQYDGAYSGRFPAHHVRKIERRDEITRPMRELAETIERELRQCQAKYAEQTAARSSALSSAQSAGEANAQSAGEAK